MDHRYLPPADAQETRQPPQQAWIADGWLPRPPDSLEQLDLLLVQVAKARVVHRDGIRFQGLRYLDPTLAAYVGEPKQNALSGGPPGDRVRVHPHEPCDLGRVVDPPADLVLVMVAIVGAMPKGGMTVSRVTAPFHAEPGEA